MTTVPQPSFNCVDWMVDRHVRSERGEHPALVECGIDGRRRVLTYTQLRAATARTADLFLARINEAGRGRRIAILGSSTLETLCAWLGAMRAGCLPFVIHPDLGEAAREALLADFRPDLIYHDRTGYYAAGIALPAIDPEEAIDPLAAIPAAAPATARQPAFCLASSGSTGRAKICVHSHGAIPAFDCHVTRALWRMCADDVVLGSSGPYFSFGLQGIHTALSLGATAVLLPEWARHEAFMETIEREGVTVFLAVPTLLHLLMARASRIYRMRTLRLCLSAGERLPDVIRSRWEAYSGAYLVDSIGTTETFLPYLTEVPGEGAGLKEVAAFEYAFTAAECASNEESAMTVALTGRAMMLGYLESRPDALRWRQRPAFETGDLFSRVLGGWSFISRRSERVKIAGHWVSPQALEAFLLTDARVLQAAAVPVETEVGLKRLRAFVVLGDAYRDGDAVTTALTRRMREELKPRALRPDRIEVVSSLASSANGKLQRGEIAAAVACQQVGAQRGVVPI